MIARLARHREIEKEVVERFDELRRKRVDLRAKKEEREKKPLRSPEELQKFRDSLRVIAAKRIQELIKTREAKE